MFEVEQPNQYAPEFIPSNGQYSSSLLENSTLGTTVANITATDQDVGIRGEVYYTITAGNDDGKFVIDNNTGMVETAGLLDRETTASYNLTVTAYDGSLPPRRRYQNGQLTINVLDVNDNSPSIIVQSMVVIPENLTKGDVVTTLSATDLDDGMYGAVKFRILSGNDAGWFALDDSTGEITINGK